ncbi:MAG: dihydrodipicolinate synthase family protein [Verrucomicrobia bacterium]|nr:dihydrodipicolinate synthase family protein [Verrucomicrobiota bacterium]
MASIESVRTRLGQGLAIPACPLALNSQRRFDERRQRALMRYYLASGVGGVAVGVHTTQFAIRDPKVGLFKPVLELAAEELRRNRSGDSKVIGVAGICGPTKQAVAEAPIARQLGYHAGLLSLGALRMASEAELIAHCQAVADIIPLFGFYLQPAVGGRVLSFSFWRRFAEIQNVVAIKIAPFNRYQSLDVVRAIAEAGRDDIALYTGNDDNIVMDLLTPFRFRVGNRTVERRIVGGLLGHWSVWTKRAVELHAECRRLAVSGESIPIELLRRATEITDCNAAFFDAANNFAGCIPGLHEILRRQGLLEGIWCLEAAETLGHGQREEIDRVCRAYPHLSDDEFVAQHRDEWLR